MMNAIYSIFDALAGSAVLWIPGNKYWLPGEKRNRTTTGRTKKKRERERKKKSIYLPIPDLKRVFRKPEKKEKSRTLLMIWDT